MKIIIEGYGKKIIQLNKELVRRCKADKLIISIESWENPASEELIEENEIYTVKRGRKPNK
jgi:hypothetical protein